MSRLDELIRELCPDGVEYKPLKEIGTIFKGMSGVTNKWAETGNCQFIDYKNVYNHIKADVLNLPYATVKKTENQFVLKTGDILFTSASETPDECAISSVIEDEIIEGIFLDDHLFGIRLHKEVGNPTYFNYYFRSNSFRKAVNKTVRGVTRFYISMPDFANIEVPVPPIEVQSELVRILDKFTELSADLSAELSAELSARKKQYEYYRDCVLTLDSHIPKVRLGDICTVITKGTTPKNYTKTGVAFVKTESFDGTRIVPERLSFIDEETHTTYLKRSILQEDDILITIAGATIGKCAMVPKEILPANTNQALAIIRLSVGNSPRYVMYLLQSDLMKQYMQKNIKGSAQPNLNLQQLNDFIIPLPELSVQNRLVSILDRFDTFCNDLSSGLPTEIEARRKQYEYYRDKLLTFKPLA